MRHKGSKLAGWTAPSGSLGPKSPGGRGKGCDRKSVTPLGVEVPRVPGSLALGVQVPRGRGSLGSRARPQEA